MKEITQEMIGLAAKGDQYAIEDLYRLTYNSVYKSAKILIQDEDTVLDIVQDSYVKAFQSLDQLDSPENFRAWIKRITTNKAKDYLKKKKPILFSEMESEDGEEIDFLDERLDHYPEMVIDRKETTRLMKEILDTLSEDQRLVVGMFYYEQMSVKEIAQTLGCSENTVKSRLNYGRKKVEVKVRDMEKKGTKLYALAPLPFLLGLFSLEASAAEIPSEAVLEAVTAKCVAQTAASAGAAGAKAAAKAGRKAARTGARSTLAAKVAAGALAVTIAGGGIAAVLSDPAPKEDLTHDELLSAYKEACRDDCELWRKDRGDYKLLDDDTVEIFYGSDSLNIVYCDRDLDGDGTEELLIGLDDPYQEYGIELTCVYTFDDGYAVPALTSEWTPSASESGDFYGEVLLLTRENKIIKYRGSDEGLFYYTFWQLSADGVTMEQIGAFTEDLKQETVTFGDQTMSSHEFRMNYFDNIADTLDWKTLVRHPGQSDRPGFWESAEEETGTLPDPQESEDPIPDPRESYERILEQYRAVLAMDSAEFLAAPENCFNGDHVAVRYYHMYHESRFFYAYRDIDGNGVEELLIGKGNDGYDMSIVDLYGFDGERAVQLVDEITLGDRSRLTLMDDGSLYLYGSGGAAAGSHTLWRIDSSGAALDTVFEYWYDFSEGYDGIYHGSDGSTVTDTEFVTMMKTYTAVTNIPWQAIDGAAVMSFDAILADIREALTVSTEDYDADMGYYDALYAHLGNGVMWQLMHRQSGDYTMCVWYAYMDMDHDGQEELVTGRGVGPENVYPDCIYKQNGQIIVGDAIYTYTEPMYGGSVPTDWIYLGG